ncbi:hypothetical protein [Bradyrhizobium erythrophlei]|uniref:Uncharacterized protein n=1 Tax=Bradyrhizobium erythrophlei TaxID=1437360 RepID=A0A1H5GKF8_9BRAD|nr:hypothetical protein [Bradyrhizobium erythrophlei]SEE16243.1 hypothetical protein SAMN05444164_7132 [Bradyrhizobium erythrophlei]
MTNKSRILAKPAVRLLLCLGGLATPASAQSTDPHHPTVLGAGVNRANITNNIRGHYYSFMAGPGHVDVELAFKEMGVFGRPLPQHLNFDFWNADGVRLSHIEVLSQGSVARRHTDADLPARQRINLAVSTQWGAIKVGGYYEIELKGAVEAAAPPVGADVKPAESEPLARP